MEKERAVLYARISLDRTGEEVGVARQLRDLRELADARGWEVIAEAVDNDISATKEVKRPGYEQVWTLVRSGKVDHVCVWQTSRFMRSRGDRARVISTFGAHNVDIVAVKGPSLDLRSAYGRGMADMMTAFDTMEGEVKSERVSAAIGDLARRGKSWGICPYGWDRVGKGVHAKQIENRHEADVVRELVDRLLAGESLNELHRDMNTRGEPSPGYIQWMKLSAEDRERRERKGRKQPPREWPKATIRALVLRDANIGVRRYRKRDNGGTEMPGEWQPIVDRIKHDRVVALLNAPDRRCHTGPRPGARKHLLTNGVGCCGVCRGPLRVARRRGSLDQTLIYTCEQRGCTGRNQARVDDLVTRVVLGRLAQPDALDWLLGDDEQARKASDRCEELQLRLDEAADSQADGKITIRQLERITARLTPELEAAQQERDAAVRSMDMHTLRDLAGPEAESRWGGMPVSVRRAVLEALGIEVVVLPRTKHGPGFEPESVHIEWKTGS
ncbi:recombinase family protein [Mycobacteroides chelonae]|uniref:Recombinase n=1 Tax=Mycobacteroides chelonae TaxID=1774 RepID=A0AB73U618_MYCCH|nr:recombinase family protein [Mycobacteroides chelonae]MEC4842599.1 recombinase family protein [Mycobacteroides chelonae]MEC4847440.1 recombinase family protein [Mycobacteroides chelonae]OLT80527.1 recombinase [Mycobacteroides chelonae]QDF71925.1 recombinase [Mycobacteroides chelonae]WED90801.1 recombinase family protein [Mycobacteroides chelonae]